MCRPGPPAAAGQPPLPQLCDLCLLDFKVNTATGRCEEPPAKAEAGADVGIQGASPPPASGSQPAYSPLPYTGPVPASTGPQMSPALPAADTGPAQPEWFNKYCVPKSGGRAGGGMGGRRGEPGAGARADAVPGCHRASWPHLRMDGFAHPAPVVLFGCWAG